ncbi:hypothetical protein C5L14_14640 [Labrys okinawensis]|uniref:Uncharacterized protein n=1 Tax=Labrys okinawensis TaxID=346911 RepID=A0A2S9QB49_9HYPH|nr:hypothetical protein C5L14_14640 [Labrys okinawensis]
MVQLEAEESAAKAVLLGSSILSYLWTMTENLPSPTAQRALTTALVSNTTDEERAALLQWVSELKDIRESDQTRARKALAVFRTMRNAKIIWPRVVKAYAKLKEHGWDNRTGTTRAFLGASAVGIAVVGTQGAGLAALGTAIGLPLMLVFGVGGVALENIQRELQNEAARRKPANERPTDPTVD